MPDASLRNAVKRKTHKERAQPSERRRHGLLEKKKDYVLRAKDYHKKEETIKTLRQKAAFRNPDEFYFAMQNAKTKDGVHQGRRETGNKHTEDGLRLMKTQDAGYLLVKAQAERKKVEKMAANLHLLGSGGGSGAKHTIFVESGSEAVRFSPEEMFDTPAELMGRTFNRPRTAQLATGTPIAGAAALTADSLKRLAQRARKGGNYKELAARRERAELLAAALDGLEREKAQMGKGRKRKMAAEGGAAPGGLLSADVDADAKRRATVYRWKAERKR